MSSLLAPVGETGQTGPPRVFAVLIVLMIVARSSAFGCVWRDSMSTHSLATPLGQINLVFKTDLI